MIVSSGYYFSEDGFGAIRIRYRLPKLFTELLEGGTSTYIKCMYTQRTVIYGGSGSNGEMLNIQSADGTSVLTYGFPCLFSNDGIVQ